MSKYVKRAEKIKQALKEVETNTLGRERGNSKINTNTLTSSKKEVSSTAAPFVDQAIKTATGFYHLLLSYL